MKFKPADLGQLWKHQNTKRTFDFERSCPIHAVLTGEHVEHTLHAQDTRASDNASENQVAKLKFRAYSIVHWRCVYSFSPFVSEYIHPWVTEGREGTTGHCASLQRWIHRRIDWGERRRKTLNGFYGDEKFSFVRFAPYWKKSKISKNSVEYFHRF